jgi:hypothetical protein
VVSGDLAVEVAVDVHPSVQDPHHTDRVVLVHPVMQRVRTRADVVAGASNLWVVHPAPDGTLDLTEGCLGLGADLALECVVPNREFDLTER